MSRTSYSVLESLSVELWREIFDYLQAYECWYSFRDLNEKIDGIIDRTILRFNFTKPRIYGYFMKKMLPSIDSANIQSLKFKESNEIKHFFSIFSLDSLTQLQVLSLDFMYSFNDHSFKFWSRLSSLKHLRLLSIRFWSIGGHENYLDEKDYVIHSIFNKDYCPSLKSFTISTGGRQRWIPTIPWLITPTKVMHIKYLSIDSLTFPDLIKLLPGLQNMKSFRIDEKLCFDKTLADQEEISTSSTPLLAKCSQLHLKLSDEISFEHIEYILKQTPNMKDIFLWGWYQLLNAKKWELLLSIHCPRLMKFELICTGKIFDKRFGKATVNFQHECQISPFWLERKVLVLDDEDYSGHDYRCDTVVRFNIFKRQNNQLERKQ